MLARRVAYTMIIFFLIILSKYISWHSLVKKSFFLPHYLFLFHFSFILLFIQWHIQFHECGPVGPPAGCLFWPSDSTPFGHFLPDLRWHTRLTLFSASDPEAAISPRSPGSSTAEWPFQIDTWAEGELLAVRGAGASGSFSGEKNQPFCFTREFTRTFPFQISHDHFLKLLIFLFESLFSC